MENDGREAKGGVLKLNSLTSLRFFAALLVFIWHVSLFIGTDFFFHLQVGYAGVGFFYILSGFILTYVYFDKLKKIRLVAVKKFYVARVAKLIPVHILTFLVSLPLAIPLMTAEFTEHTKAKAAGTAVVNLGLVQSWFPNPNVHFSFNGVAWSISVELFFYAMFPLIIFLIARYYQSLKIKSILLIMGILWLGMTLIFLPQQAMLDQWALYIFPPSRLIDFVMGILLAIVYLKLPQRGNLKLFNSPKKATILEIGVLVLLAIGFLTSVLAPQSLRFALWLMPFWVAVIFVFAQEKGRVSGLLAKRPLIFLGEISFSFYMIHQLVIRYISDLHLTGWATILVSFTLAVALSALTYVLFEEPSRIRLKSYLEKTSTRNYFHFRRPVSIEEDTL